jgi:hypothetical protein
MNVTTRAVIAIVVVAGIAGFVAIRERQEAATTAKTQEAAAAFAKSLDKIGHDAGVLYGVHCDRAKLDSEVVDQGGGNLAFRIRCYNPEDVGTATGAVFRFTGVPGTGVPNVELVSR